MKLKYLVLLVLLSSNVYGLNHYITLNKSELPYVYNTTYNLFGEPFMNVTSVKSGYVNSLFNFSFYNQTVETLKISITIPSTENKNITEWIYIKTIPENYSVNLTYNFTIIDDTKTFADFIMIDFNEFQYALCDYTLPQTLHKNISIVGNASQQINISYNPSFFTIPSTINLSQSGFYNLDIQINIPNLTQGFYTQNINFSISNSSVIFHFDILDCLSPPLVIGDYLSVCNANNMTAQQYTQCIGKLAEYWSAYYEQILEAQQNITINNTVIQYVNYTERIPVLDLKDTNIASAIAVLPTSIQNLITEHQTKDTEISSLRNQITSLEGERNQIFLEAEKRMQSALQPLINENTMKQNTIDYFKKKYVKKSKVWIAFSIILFCGLLGWLYYEYNENMMW